MALWGLGVSLHGAAGPKFHVLPLGAVKHKCRVEGEAPDPACSLLPSPLFPSPSVHRIIKGTSSRRPSFGPMLHLARASHHF